MKITAPNQKKLDNRSRRTIFVGYEAASKVYRVFDPRTRRVHISRDIVFDEAASWNWNGELDDVEPGFTIELESSEQAPASTVISATSMMTSSLGSTSTSPVPMTSSATHGVGLMSPTTPAHAAGGAVEFASPPEGEANLDADHDDDAPLWFHRLDNVLGSSSAPGLAHR